MERCDGEDGRCNRIEDKVEIEGMRRERVQSDRRNFEGAGRVARWCKRRRCYRAGWPVLAFNNVPSVR